MMGQGKPRPIRIKVKGNNGNQGSVSFEMLENGKAKDVLEFDKKKEEVGKEDWHEILFEMEGPGGSGLRFHPDPAKAIWVARGDENTMPDCPAASSSDPLGEFGGDRVLDEGRTLVVRNDNASYCMLSFRLNFVSAADQSPDPRIVAYHDPGVKNWNGTGGG